MSLRVKHLQFQGCVYEDGIGLAKQLAEQSLPK
jgi:hypothetical protein